MMNVSVIVNALAVLVLLSIPIEPGKPPAQKDETPEEVTVCHLKSDPGKYNHKLVRITGFISHGFEDFGVYDPACPDWPQIWLEYGGTKGSDTMYCCGVTPNARRPSDVIVENIKIPLVTDDQFQRFDKIIGTERDSTMHGTIIGRFFSGQPEKYPNGRTGWGGYGHMGCCSLLVIQQVVVVDPHDRSDLDYHSSADQPNIDKAGCGYRILSSDWRFSEALGLQQQAESGERAWAFDDPTRVVKELLARKAGIDQTSIVNLKTIRTARGRIVFTWAPPKTKATYMVVVSRPYTLSFYAKNSQRVAWIPIAAYKVGCDADNSVRRIR